MFVLCSIICISSILNNIYTHVCSVSQIYLVMTPLYAYERSRFLAGAAFFCDNYVISRRNISMSFPWMYIDSLEQGTTSRAFLKHLPNNMVVHSQSSFTLRGVLNLYVVTFTSYGTLWKFFYSNSQHFKCECLKHK